MRKKKASPTNDTSNLYAGKNDENVVGEKILILDDEPNIVHFLSELLTQHGYQCYSTTSPNEALDLLSHENIGVTIIDYLMPEIDGLTFAQKVKELYPETEIIIITGKQDTRNVIRALRLGVYDYILKPFEIEEVLISLQRCIEHRKLVIAQKNHEKELEAKIEEATQSLKKLNAELQETKEYLEQLLNTSVDGIFILNSEFYITYANEGALNILNTSPNDLLNRPLSILLPGGKEELKYLKQHLLEMGAIKNYETEFITINKTTIPVNISFSILKDSQNKIHSIFAIFKDITEQKTLERQLIEMSNKDSLTNLYNQRYFYERLEAEIERAKRQRHPLSLLLFDIDQFKTYNDCHGHLEGDRVLQTVGQLIRDCTREYVDIGCRYGGDEFTVILPETDEEQAVLVAERIRASFQAKKFDKLTISIGVITYRENLSIRSFVRFAGNCMYDAKRAGGNKVFVFRINDSETQRNKNE